MARTIIAAQALSSTYYPATPLAPSAADLLLTAGDDPTDRETVIVNGKTVLLAHNTDTDPHTITITSALDTFNRAGDITEYEIAAGKIARFGPFNTAGWATAGKLQIDTDDPLVRLAVVTLP